MRKLHLKSIWNLKKYSADNIAEGQELFKTNCVTCHGDGGKGGIGPNLTDTHWINIKEKSFYLKCILDA